MKRTPLKKKRKPDLKKKAWDVFSIYIRKRDKATCVTCGERKWDEEKGEFTIKGFNAGHYRHNVLDFDEENINCQCVRCNFRLSGNLGEYTLYLIDKIGIEGVNNLRQRASMAQKGVKVPDEYYKDIIEKYGKLIKEMS